MVNNQAYYKDGLQESVYQTHTWRTVSNSIDFVIPLIKPDLKVLDVGSGPGTITIDFAKYIPQGSIIGVEPTPDIVEVANQKKIEAGNPANVSFETGSIYQLPFEDNTFDLVYAHQVIIHLEDPISGLRELKRVTKRNGFVCVKDADLSGGSIYPLKYQADFDMFLKVRTENSSTDPIAGRNLREKAIKAGYIVSRIDSSSSTWTISNPKEKELWSSMFINRAEKGGEVFSQDAKKNEELKQTSINMWREFAADDTGYSVLFSGQLTYHKE